MTPEIELDPVDLLAVATVGLPGQRRFFLRAARGAEQVTLACEKFHIQGLVARVQQLLDSHGLGTELDVGPTPAVRGDLEPAWTVGELGLGFHEAKGKFVVVAREATEEEPVEGAEPPGAVARFWARPAQMRAFARQAEQVLRSGRPTCTYCGLPIDPGGHPCPASNGSRPIF